MIDATGWPTDYVASRDRFIELARSCGAQTSSYPVKSVGPDGGALSIDVAQFTSDDDEHVIILTSGVHGIEGFIGACTQFKALTLLANTGLPDRVGIVMIHAVNPWGFAHLRRVDVNNVDVNRNFTESSASLPASHPQYALLDPVINARKPLDVSGEIRYWLSAGKLIVRHRGITALSRPIAEGQYEFPYGLFYGGVTMSESCRAVQNIVLGLTANVQRITVLDVHSGLGPPAVATLIGNSNIVSPEACLAWLQSHYTQPVVMDNASGNAYNAKGTFGQWCLHALSDKRVLYLCVEIGTVNPVRLFSALRRENQAHHWSTAGSGSYVQTKQALLEVFAPRSRRWRHRSVAQGLQVLTTTLDLPNG